LGNFAVTLRLPNVYGPGPKSSSADRGILNAMIRKALSGKPLTIYGDGNFIRDYIYIDDVAEAFLLAGAEIDTLKGNYYVIGTGVGYTMKDAVGIINDEVMQKTGKNVEITFVPPPENISQIEYRNFVADSKSFNSLTGWKARISLHEGIKRTINYFLKEL
jgi:UDP-glucose 4-epimerase